MCTHDLCFEQKLEKHHNFSSENYHLNSREILQYITWACLRNGFLTSLCNILHLFKHHKIHGLVLQISAESKSCIASVYITNL